ncbi:MAG: glycosyltransferase [Solirubrobacterales bacterium]
MTPASTQASLDGAQESPPKALTVTAIVIAAELTDFGRRCMAHLLELPEQPEVLFVPDEPVDGLDPRIKMIPSGLGAVLGEKRQIGLENASGEVVAQIDDDAYPHSSWLRIATSALARDPEIVAVVGPNLTPPTDSPLERLSGDVYASRLVSGPDPWAYRIAGERDVADAPGANLVIRRAEALEIGYEGGVGEDTRFLNELVARGLRIRYLPAAIVFHSRRPLWRRHLRQLFRWSRARSASARALRGNSLQPTFFAPSALLIAIASGAVVRGRLQRVWRGGMLAYLVCCIAAGASRSPGRWWRLSLAIAATHVVYGFGFLQGMLGASPPERAPQGEQPPSPPVPR